MLIKRAPQPIEGGKWGLVGGFVDRDETLIQAAKREAMEETGWEIKDVKLMRIIDNPNRPSEDRQNIVFIYTAKAVQKTGEPDWESTDQKWFDLTDLPPKKQMAFDHLENINYFRNQLKNN